MRPKKTPRALLLSILILSLMPQISCKRQQARDEVARTRFFVEILKREDRGWIGEDGYFKKNLLDNPYAEVRQWSAVALGRIADRRALPLLFHSLRSGDAAVRAASAFAIGEIEDRPWTGERDRGRPSETSAQLIRLLADPSLTVQWRAVEALGKTGSPADAIPIIRRLEDLKSSDDQPEARAFLAAAVTALVKLNGPSVAPALEKLAGAKDPGIRWRALDALVRLQSRTLGRCFVANLKSLDPDVRICAARGIGVAGDSGAAPLLLPLLPPRQERSSDINPLALRCAALQALGEIRGAGIVSSIESALSADPIDDAHPDQKNFAIQAAEILGNMGAQEGEPALLELLKCQDAVAHPAILSLAKILKGNPERFFSLVDRNRLAATASNAWAQAMGELGGSEAVRELNRMLVNALQGGPASDSLPFILTALAKAGAPGLQEILAPFFDSHDAAVLRAAVAAYRPKAGSKTPWEPITRAFASSAATADMEARIGILAYLEPWIQERQVQETLRPALLDPDRHVRLMSSALLRQAGLADIPENQVSNGSLTDAFCLALAASRKNSTIAIIETNRGNLEIELFREDAPVTVAIFALLATGGAYDGMELSQAPLQRRIEGRMSNSKKGFARRINSEVNMRPFERGSIGMALAGGNSDTSRFFISLAPQPYSDGSQTCFGRVISGMPVADRIVAGDRVKRVTIKETISFLNYHRY